MNTYNRIRNARIFLRDSIKAGIINFPDNRQGPVIPMVMAVIDGKEIYVMEDNNETAA